MEGSFVKEMLRQQIFMKRSALTPEQVQVKTDQDHGQALEFDDF
jgi:hypothetical protein